MRISDKAIVLQSVRHGDKKYILKLYTRQHGLVSVLAVAGPKSRIRTGTILPLSLVDAEIILRQNKEIHRLTEASVYYIFDHIPTSLERLGIAQFINEVLIRSIREQQANTSVYELAETCLRFLNDAPEGFMNLHLYFLIELARHLGFEPQNNYHQNTPFFDCRAGRFTSVELAFPLGLSDHDSKLFSAFMNVNVLRQPVTNQQRRALLDILEAYYRLHISGFNELKSLAVLKEVVGGQTG